jgi:restriction system protein
VQETGGRGTADGGVDHVLTRDGERTVGQAKHWRSQRVGVTLVRELYDVQRAMQVSPAMFVAVGTVQGRMCDRCNRTGHPIRIAHSDRRDT